MKPPPFDYRAPESLDEALALRAATAGEGVVLAGGQSLLPILNLRLAAPSLLIDVGRLPELGSIAIDDGAVRIGATVRQRAAERSMELAVACPLLTEALAWIGHPSTRNRGTVGGSVAHADPAAELPVVLLALDAGLHVRSGRGERVVAAAEFFHGFMSTALEPDDLLVAVDIEPSPPRTGVAFVEVARRHGDFALVAVAATVRLAESGAIASARIALAGVGATPLRARGAEEALAGARPVPEEFREAAEAALAEIEPHGDLHASASYRRHVAAVLVARALATAAVRAEDST